MALRGSVQPLSALLAETIADEVVTLGELVDRLARRGFGLLMIVLALPTLIPVLPPLTAATIGLLYIILSVQMIVGLDRPWLPARVRRYRLSARAVATLRRRGIPLLQRIERFSRPRPLLYDDRIVARVVAAVVLVLGVVLFSPAPFLNTLPALAVLILGVGLVNRDSLFLLIGVTLAVIVILIIVFAVGSLAALFKLVFRR